MLKNLLFFISLVLAAGMFMTMIFGQKDPTDLGVREGRLKECPDSANCVSSQSREQSRRVEPLKVPEDLHDPMARIKEIVLGLGRTEVVEEEPDYLWFRVVSKYLRFRDDLEFFHDRTAGVVQVRSASRLGRYDFGVNRKRVETIRSFWNGGRP